MLTLSLFYVCIRVNEIQLIKVSETTESLKTITMHLNSSLEKGLLSTQIIRSRRSIFPHSYTNKKIPTTLLEELLENANHAPTHRLTEPWRFKVIAGEKLGTLGDLLAMLYKEKMSEATFSEMKYQKTAQKPRQCSHVLAICMERDVQERVPEWEEIAATAMAVHNIWLSASAYGIGAYWSSPSTIESLACRAFLNLGERQRCLGFLFMGYHQMPEQPTKRGPIQEKIEWL